MANMMDQVNDFVRRLRATSCAREVVYRYHDGTEATIQATIGKSLFRVDDISGITTRTRSLDFIIEATALSRVPHTRDAIIYQDRVFEVAAPEGEPCWHWSGDDCKSYRVHTNGLGADIPNTHEV